MKHSRFNPATSSPFQIGGWNTLVSDQSVTLQTWQIAKLETVLNDRYLPAVRQLFLAQHPGGNRWFSAQNAPAPIVRFDMAPMMGDAKDQTPLGIWEIEANTAGLGIGTKLGLPIAQRVSSALKQAQITKIGYAASASRSNQAGDMQILMDELTSFGIETVAVDLSDDIPDSLPLWLRAGAEDLATDGPIAALLPQCLMWHPGGGGTKEYMFDIDPTATRASDIVNLDSVPNRFDTGVVLKPINGWGARDITIFARQQPWKKRGDSAGKLVKVLQKHRAAGIDDQYMLQRLTPPSVVSDGFLAWRVLAVYQPKQARYQVIGGIWNYRKGDIRLHGTPDTVNGPIFVEK